VADRLGFRWRQSFQSCSIVKTFGLTGGIGMGKSTAAQCLRARGLAVLDTDDLAREVVAPGQPALAEIQQVFGPAMVDATGQLNRSALAQVVFADAAARRQLEGILHPRITALWRAQLDQWRVAGRTAAVVVIPLLFETGVEAQFDAVICVACSAATQRERLQSRGWTPEQIAQREAAQLPVAEKMARSRYVVWSEGSLDVLGRQVDRVVGR
jgi:dephospho-CoA kinase